MRRCVCGRGITARTSASFCGTCIVKLTSRLAERLVSSLGAYDGAEGDSQRSVVGDATAASPKPSLQWWPEAKVYGTKGNSRR
jgi:hypothetical protein